MNAVAIPHIADAIGGTDAIADCVRAKARSCIVTMNEGRRSIGHGISAACGLRCDYRQFSMTWCFRRVLVSTLEDVL
jgi:hypothetical protein